MSISMSPAMTIITPKNKPTAESSNPAAESNGDCEAAPAEEKAKAIPATTSMNPSRRRYVLDEKTPNFFHRNLLRHNG